LKTSYLTIGKRNINTGKIFIVLQLLFVISAISQTAYAAEEKTVLTENGIRLETVLPPECAEIDSLRSRLILMSLEDISVSLEIEDISIEKKQRREQETYQWLKGRDSSTTFEELPDISTPAGVFKVNKLIYDSNGNLTTSLTAFCNLNYRYIYVITLRNKGDIPYEIIQKFTAVSVTSTPLKVNYMMVCVIAVFALVGLYYIVSDISEKHFGNRTTGVITGIHQYRKSAGIIISFYLPDGRMVLGEHTTLSIMGLIYKSRVGETIPITYLEKNPANINIISDKSGYVTGLLFILFATLFGYLMVFHM